MKYLHKIATCHPPLTRPQCDGAGDTRRQQFMQTAGIGHMSRAGGAVDFHLGAEAVWAGAKNAAPQRTGDTHVQEPPGMGTA